MISYTITVSTEDTELNVLLHYLISKISKTDEIVLQMDSTTVTDAVKDVIEKHKDKIKNLTVIDFPLNKDFASFKNNLKKYCTKEWIFNIDADEIPAEGLMADIHEILKENSDTDMFLVPRWNTVEGITDEHIEKWRWNYDDLGRVNWPDWQTRIYRNVENIVWKNKVHERLNGFSSYSNLPDEIHYCLFHNKTIERQEKQNNFYNTI
jgi:hypothetical protein